MTLEKAKVPNFLFEDELTSAQMNFIQNEYIKAIDGYNGGTYALNHPLTITGDMVFGDSTATFPDNLTVYSTALFREPAYFYDDIHHDGYMYGSMIFKDGTLDLFNGIVTIGQTGSDALLVQAFSAFTEIATFTNSVFMYSDTTIGTDQTDTLTIPATTALTGPTKITQGHILQKSIDGFDLDFTYDPTTTWKVIWTTLTADHTATITASPSVSYADGDHIIFSNLNQSHAVTVMISTTLLFVLPAATLHPTAAGDEVVPSWCQVDYHAGVWQTTQFGYFGAV